MSDSAGVYDLVAIGGAWALAAARAAARQGQRVLVALQPGGAGEARDEGRRLRREMIRRQSRNLYDSRRWLIEQRQANTTIHWDADESATEIAARGGNVVAGHVVFTGNATVAVHGREVRFERALLALEPTAVETAADWTHDNWFRQGELPARVAVVGDDNDALELAQALARAGCQAHLVAGEIRLVQTIGHEAQSLVLAGLRRDGVRIHLGQRPVRDELVGQTRMVTIGGASGQQKLFVDQVIAEPRRQMKLDRMALTAAGIRIESGRIVVDARMRTANSRVGALGAACGHEPGAEAALLERFLGNHRKRDAGRAMYLWTDPQVAHLGATASMSIVDAHDTLVVTQNDLALPSSQAEPLYCSAQWRRETGQPAAVTVAAHDAAELATPITLALAGLLDWEDIAAGALPPSRSGRLMAVLATQVLSRQADDSAGRSGHWWSRTA